MTKNGMRPVPPGEILKEEFLTPAGLRANALANAIGVPANRITAILKAPNSNGASRRGDITGDTALRLAAFFGTTADLWLNLQKSYDLRLAEKALPRRELKRIERKRAELVPS